MTERLAMSGIALLLPTSGYSEAEIERRRSVIRRWTPPELPLHFLVSPQSPEFLDDAHHFGEAVNEAAATLRAVEPTEVAVVIEGGALDPGLAAARRASPVPVVGPGEAAMFVASIMGKRVSIVTVDEHAVSAAKAMLDVLPAVPPIASVRSMELPVRRVMDNFEEAERRIIRESEAALAQDGAEAIFLGAMILGMLPGSDAFQSRLGVPVLNPVRIAVSVAVQLAQMRVER